MTLTSASPRSITASRALSVALGQGGGGVLVGTVAHGNAVTFNGSFGERTNNAFRHWHQGSEIFINGVESAAEVSASSPDTTEIWREVGGAVNIQSADLRHERLDQHYSITADGTLTFPKAFDTIADERKFYFAKWVKTGSTFRKIAIAAYTGLSGSFFVPVQGERGEAITVTGTFGTASGYITAIFANSVTIEMPGAIWNKASLNGAIVAGDESGAELTIDTGSGYALPGVGKPLRIYSGDNAVDWGAKFVPTNTGVTNIDGYNNSNVEVFRFDPAWTGYSEVPETWRLYEAEIDFSGGSGSITQRIDNVTTDQQTGLSLDSINTIRGFYLVNIGLEAPGVGSLSKAEIGMLIKFGESIADNDLKRLVIGDAPTLADCTHIEIQRHTNWSSSAVDFIVNQGSFSSLSGKYLFAVGAGFNELGSIAL